MDLVDTAGTSLQREHDRRVAAREARIRAEHPRLGRLVLGLTDEPAGTTALRHGAAGERRAVTRIRELVGPDVLLLAHRRLGRGRRDGDLDLVAVGPSGVVVVDVLRYDDADVRVRRRGGLRTPREETLWVRGRDGTAFVDGVEKQRRAVLGALAGRVVPVRAALCFVDARLPRFGVLQVGGVPVLEPKATARLLRAPGPWGPQQRADVHAHLARVLPPA